MKLTAAGTVQESHLFPSHNSTELLTENAAKIVLFYFDSTLQLIFFSKKIKFTEKSKHCSEVIIFFVLLPPLTERWPSGRRRTPGKCVGAESVSRVRIPLSPQKSVNQEVARFTLFFYTYQNSTLAKGNHNISSRSFFAGFLPNFSLLRMLFAEIVNNKT